MLIGSIFNCIFELLIEFHQYVKTSIFSLCSAVCIYLFFRVIYLFFRVYMYICLSAQGLSKRRGGWFGLYCVMRLLE